MAFYQDQGNKSREQKRRSAEMRGGFEDEGTRYQDGGQSPDQGKTTKQKQTGEGRPARGKSAGQGQAAKSQGSQSKQSGSARSGESPKPRGRQAAPGEAAQGQGQPSARKPAPQRARDGEGQQQRSKQAGPGRTAQGRAQSSTRTPAPRRTPRGEASARREDASTGATRNQSGRYRFTTGSAQLYQERGSGIAPRPYGEQREARRQDGAPPPRQGRFGPSAEAYRYAPQPQGNPYDADDRDDLPPENLLSGRNPIREALKSGRDLEKLLVAKGELSGSAREIVQLAKQNQVPVQEVDRARLDAITKNHQGMLAFASAHQYHTLEDMLALAKERGEAPFLVLLDGITDPHNLGAIIRTAECAGAHGVIVQERRAVGLTPAAVKASAGAVEYLPVARVKNLTQTIELLKAQNIWVFAADMEGEPYATVDYSGPLALVIGAEGEGVSRRVLDACDRRVALPVKGQIASLNASVAAGILLYAIMGAR